MPALKNTQARAWNVEGFIEQLFVGCNRSTQASCGKFWAISGRCLCGLCAHSELSHPGAAKGKMPSFSGQEVSLPFFQLLFWFPNCVTLCSVRITKTPALWPLSERILSLKEPPKFQQREVSRRRSLKKYALCACVSTAPLQPPTKKTKQHNQPEWLAKTLRGKTALWESLGERNVDRSILL